MVAVFACLALFCGVAVTVSARRYPSYAHRLSPFGGGIFVAGLVLLTLAFPVLF
ncbi:MAG TPA: hypothetical protein VN702_12065 [Acetobacteraceae bacterium]|nr:hypothetical protein [Acetobacteraceae bacterium]